MTLRSRIWLALAAIFTLVNVAGIGMAAAAGEGPHTAIHVGLSLVGAFAIWRLALRAIPRRQPALEAGGERLEQLQQSVDAIAIEVERIGEAQRFHTKLQQERTEPRR